MNWRYLIFPNWYYADTYSEWERVNVDELNNVFLKKWKHLDNCSDMLYKIEDNISWLIKWFWELWNFSEEKGEFFSFENKVGDKFFFYNSTEEIEIFNWNKLSFIEILFEDRKVIIEEKLSAYLNYIYANNVSKIKNLANTATIKNKTELIQNLWNENFLGILQKIDKILLKELYFLSQKNFYGWSWHTYLYVFKEEEWRLRPVRFEWNFKNMSFWNELFDKVAVLMAFQWKNKINLFFEKLLNHTIFLKKQFITKSDLQNFYNFYFKQ